jgi:hypothetical protein
MVGVTRFLPLCAVLLVLPAIAAVTFRLKKESVMLTLELRRGISLTALTTLFLLLSPLLSASFAEQPSLASTYQGTIHNTTFDVTTTLALTSIVQDQGSISGNVVIGPGLGGSGPFTGTINADGSVNYTDTPTDGGPPIFFTGLLHTDGLFGGTYSAPSVAQEGTWQTTPAPLTFNVDATLGWQTTSLNVTAGQQLSFSAEGAWTVDYRFFSYVGPDG